jgi:patatin-like phospholipase/acyl hydrolase
MATISILSIDGGGIRGAVPAAFLNRLEQETGRPVHELFDYIAGTSTGGILALGLGLNKPGSTAPYTAAELLALYLNEGGHIFSRDLFHIVTALGNLNGPKYPEDGVDEVLQRYFAGRRLSDARANLLVTAYAIELRCPFFFRSWQASAMASHDFEAWHVARSTSAAPTYFPPFQARAGDGGTYSLIDGGVYANNPTLCAWVEARDRHPDDEIMTVSLGTGNESKKVTYADAKGWGLAGWAPHLIDIIFDGVSDTVDVELDQMLNTGPRKNHYRFQTDLQGDQQKMDDTDLVNVRSLQALGEQLARGADFIEVCGRLTSAADARSAANRSVV